MISVLYGCPPVFSIQRDGKDLMDKFFKKSFCSGDTAAKKNYGGIFSDNKLGFY